MKFLSVLVLIGMLVGCGDDFPVQPEASPEYVSEMVAIPAVEFVRGTNAYGRHRVYD